MSFPRAAIKRFNEATDTSTPAPGFYDPKFLTDVAVASTFRAGVSYGGSTGGNSLRARSSSRHRYIPDSNEPGNTSLGARRLTFNNGRPSRNSSSTSFARLSRRRSSTSGIMTVSSSGGPPESLMRRNRSNIRVVGKTNSKTKVPPKPRSPSNTRTRTSSICLTRGPSSTTTYAGSGSPQQIFVEILKDTLKSEGAWNTNKTRVMTTPSTYYNYHSGADLQLEESDLEPGEVTVTYGCGPSPLPQKRRSGVLLTRSGSDIRSGDGATGPKNPCNIFDEIQTLAESLQTELSEYKQKLSKERIRSQELEAKKLELEFINHSFKRQLEKYESVQESWELDELTSRTKLSDLTRDKDNLESQVADLQKKLESTEESESKLQIKVSLLEDEQQQWQKEKADLEVTIKELKETLKSEEKHRQEVEEKIRALESQMETCYHTCEGRMADTEILKETYEVQIHELSEKVKELLAQLEAMRREADTQKMLMELMKAEQEELKNKTKGEDNANKIDN